jgi:hypothetical protein
MLMMTSETMPDKSEIKRMAESRGWARGKAEVLWNTWKEQRATAEDRPFYRAMTILSIKEEDFKLRVAMAVDQCVLPNPQDMRDLESCLTQLLNHKGTSWAQPALEALAMLEAAGQDVTELMSVGAYLFPNTFGSDETEDSENKEE